MLAGWPDAQVCRLITGPRDPRPGKNPKNSECTHGGPYGTGTGTRFCCRAHHWCATLRSPGGTPKFTTSTTPSCCAHHHSSAGWKPPAPPTPPSPDPTATSPTPHPNNRRRYRHDRVETAPNRADAVHLPSACIRTTAIHAGEQPDPTTLASAPNIVMSIPFPWTKLRFSALDQEGDDGFFYTRWEPDDPPARGEARRWKESIAGRTPRAWRRSRRSSSTGCPQVTGWSSATWPTRARPNWPTTRFPGWEWR